LKSFILFNFQYFLKKNKIIQCRLLTTTLQPLGLSFFNSINKLLIILYFESFSISFSLLFVSYMLYNSKCCEFFKHVTNLSRKKNPKMHHHFGHFFIEKWACEVKLPCFLQGQKNDFNELECLYLTMHKVEISEIFTTYLKVTILQDPMVTCVKKVFFSKIWYWY